MLRANELPKKYRPMAYWNAVASASIAFVVPAFLSLLASPLVDEPRYILGPRAVSFWPGALFIGACALMVWSVPKAVYWTDLFILEMRGLMAQDGESDGS